MTKLILCHSALAKNPYFFMPLGVNIYSIEELCFLLKENAYILDEDVLDMGLCDFLINEAEMPRLGNRLKDMLEGGVSPGEFIMTILEDSMYLDDEELSGVKQALVDSSGLDRHRKHKKRGDNMLSNGKYALALDEYRYILDAIDRDYDRELYAAIQHNMGTAYARMFLLKEASECFFSAYELSGERESAIQFLLAYRAVNDEEKYERLILRYGFNDDIRNEAEKRYNEMKEPSEGSARKKEMDSLLKLRESGKVSEYYKKLEEILSLWKKDYRRTMGV
ncbi:MAG: hypothetical protein K5770_01685 [Lachnospiraceae bacterium]|nr:hypothetical protein [Lachnospiraceae bacterium]